jgi:hypothetical protein
MQEPPSFGYSVWTVRANQFQVQAQHKDTYGIRGVVDSIAALVSVRASHRVAVVARFIQADYKARAEGNAGRRESHRMSGKLHLIPSVTPNTASLAHTGSP